MKIENFGSKIVEDFEWYFEKKYITPRDGNACIKLNEEEFLITPSGVQKQNMTLDVLIKIDKNGNKIEPSKCSPSIETAAHLIALKHKKSEVSVHVHSLNTVSLFSLANKLDFLPLLEDNLKNQWPELFRYTKLGKTVPFLSPGSHELHESIRDSFILNSNLDILVLDRHGVVASGESLEACKEYILRLEHVSEVLLKMLTASQFNLNVLK